jgi:hypothetical protein
VTDILTHVLAGYVLGTALSFRVRWLDRRFVTVVMLGATLPDLTKISLLVPSRTIQEAVGLPFFWYALHTPFGTILTAGITALLCGRGLRGRIFPLLLVGGASHFVLDALLINPSRFSEVLLWPLAVELVPLPMLVLSSDRLPTVVAIVVATATWMARRRIERPPRPTTGSRRHESDRR